LELPIPWHGSPKQPCRPTYLKFESLSVGEQLSAPLRLVGRPIGRRVRGPSTACAIDVFDLDALGLQPQPFAWSGKGRVGEAIRCRQLRAVTLRRTSCRRLFSVEDADPPRSFSDLVEPSPNHADL